MMPAVWNALMVAAEPCRLVEDDPKR